METETTTRIISISKLPSQIQRREMFFDLGTQMISECKESNNFESKIFASLDQISDSSILQECMLGFTKALVKLDDGDSKGRIIPGLLKLVENMKSKERLYEESIFLARRKLVDIYKSDGDWINAAEIITYLPSGMPINNVVTSDAEKMDVYINSANKFLQLSDVSNADLMLGKAGQYLKDMKENSKLLNNFKFCQAKLLDMNGEHLKAVPKYYELVSTNYGNDGTKLDILKLLIKSAVLAYPSEYRNEILKKLSNSQVLQKSNLYSIVQKMSRNQLVVMKSIDDKVTKIYNEIFQFKENTTTNLDEINAKFCYHNTFAISLLFENIDIDTFAKLVAVDKFTAIQACTNLITNNFLNAYIDQIDNVIIFSHKTLLNASDSQQKNDDSQPNQKDNDSTSLENIDSFDTFFGSTSQTPQNVNEPSYFNDQYWKITESHTNPASINTDFESGDLLEMVEKVANFVKLAQH
ncbi:hypothetical protein BB558_001156 [Smittium angustum]|uniref:COP9 signalosome complex subunit 4 n=1 Tax=Smittium angustum TaxID=133377 RepID=A0A2U1JC78_SMIAN|nr:hypothetical protein BB558_001156 [Smittium angustum]